MRSCCRHTESGNWSDQRVDLKMHPEGFIDPFVLQLLCKAVKQIVVYRMYIHSKSIKVWIK